VWCQGQNGPKLLVVCVDGTWCADSTSTTTNVEIVAKSFAEARFTREEPGATDDDELFDVVIEPGNDRQKAGKYRVWCGEMRRQAVVTLCVWPQRLGCLLELYMYVYVYMYMSMCVYMYTYTRIYPTYMYYIKYHIYSA
jgi:hypothetical protein